MTTLGNLLRRSPQNAIGHTAWGPWDESVGEAWSGATITLETSRDHLTVYGCARFIADGISTLPVDVIRRMPDGSPRPIATPQVLVQPSPEVDFITFAGQILWSLLLDGNAYVHKHYDGGLLVGLTVLDPAVVSVIRADGRLTYVAGSKTFTTFELAHIKGAMWPGCDKGMSPVEAARQTIGMGISAQEYAARFFGQGLSLSGVLESPQQLEDGAARQLAKNFSRRHGGAKKAHLPVVLEGGVTWKPTGITNEQAQFLESRKFTAAQIAAEMFLIDPTEMGYPVDGSSLTYANLEQRNARKVQVTFLPWIRRLEVFLTSLVPRGQYVKLNVNGLLRGDTKTRFDAYAVGISNGFLTSNEAREFEDWEPLDNPPGGQP